MHELRYYSMTKDIKFEPAKGWDNVVIPERKTKCSAGYDFSSAGEYELQSGKVTLVHTGIKASMPSDKYLQLSVRSSLGKKGILLANGVGIVDCDYHSNPDNDGEIGFLLYNINPEPFKINVGDRVGQGVFLSYYKTVDDNADGKRCGGFGSSGK